MVVFCLAYVIHDYSPDALSLCLLTEVHVLKSLLTQPSTLLSLPTPGSSISLLSILIASSQEGLSVLTGMASLLQGANGH